MYKILNNLSEEKQIECILNDPLNIRYIFNPSEKVQLLAVNIDSYGESLKYIKDPCLEVQLKAVGKSGRNIRYIKDPCLEVQLKAIEENHHSIKFIKDPCLEVQLAVIERGKGLSIQYFRDPCLEVQLAAVRINANAIQYIFDPCLEVQIETVKNFVSHVSVLNIDIELMLNTLDVLPKKFFEYLLTNHYPFTEELKNSTKYKQAVLEAEV